MKILKKCLTCGAEFIASKMSNKYCCRECERDASRKREAKRKKSVRESEKEAALDKERDAVASRPFLTPSDVALLLDMSVSTVYRCFYSGIIKAVRIRRKTLVRREDLDKYFEDAGPYRKRSYKRKQEQEYYTLQEIMDKYKIGRKAVWGRCDRLGIPKVYEGRNTFYSKKLIDANFSELLDVIDIDNYYTLSQIMEMYNMTQGAALCFVKYHAVPRVKRNGRSYYSKVHIDCIKHKTDEIDPDWYSYEEAMQKYGITKDQVSYTLKTYSIKTEKRGKFTMIYRTDFDNIMHQRLQNSTPLIKSNGEECLRFIRIAAITVRLQRVKEQKTIPVAPVPLFLSLNFRRNEINVASKYIIGINLMFIAPVVFLISYDGYSSIIANPHCKDYHITRLIIVIRCHYRAITLKVPFIAIGNLLTILANCRNKLFLFAMLYLLHTIID